MLIGMGYDIHPLANGRPCILAGVRLEHASGPQGHSDGDVVAHAVIDALLGAAGRGDIGTRYPDDDPVWAGADSMRLLGDVARDLRGAGYRPGNLDVTVFAAAPRIGPARAAMIVKLAAALDLSERRVNVKAKTMNEVGPVADGLAVAAQALVSLLEDGDG